MMDSYPYIELLRSLVRIPSPSFVEKQRADFLQRWLEERGMVPRRIGNNLICLNSRFDSGKRTLALDAHIDTVPAADSYTRDPHDPGTDGSIVYGLGSNDDGGCVVSSIAGFRHFFDTPLPFNLMLILSCEEERSGPGGSRLLFSENGPFASGELPRPHWAIVCEPTSLKAATSERGLLVLDGTAQGVSGHAARGEGVNALYIATDDIQRLRAHRFARVSPAMGEVKLNVTCISAGSAHNVIPDKCSFTVDIRPTEQYDNLEILNELQALCKSTLAARNLSNRSSATRPGSPLLAAADKLGLECFSSPTTSNWMRMDCDCIKLGPGESSRSHKADEYILCSEIEQGIDTYIKFIEAFYGDTLE